MVERWRRNSSGLVEGFPPLISLLSTSKPRWHYRAPVLHSDFRPWGLGFRVQGLRFRQLTSRHFAASWSCI